MEMNVLQVLAAYAGVCPAAHKNPNAPSVRKPTDLTRLILMPLPSVSGLCAGACEARSPTILTIYTDLWGSPVPRSRTFVRSSANFARGTLAADRDRCVRNLRRFAA